MNYVRTVYIHPYHGVIKLDYWNCEQTHYRDEYELLVSMNYESFTPSGNGCVKEIEDILNSLGTKKVTRILVPLKLVYSLQNAISSNMSSVFYTTITNESDVHLIQENEEIKVESVDFKRDIKL